MLFYLQHSSCQRGHTAAWSCLHSSSPFLQNKINKWLHLMITADLDFKINLTKKKDICLKCQNVFPPPDTTTFALVSSGRSLFVRFCSNHSETPAAGVAATAVAARLMRTKKQTRCFQWRIDVCLPVSAWNPSGVTVPSADAALPPAAAASNDVPLTVKILTGSLHLTVLRAFPLA